MLWGTIKEGDLPESRLHQHHSKAVREDSIGSLDVSSFSTDSNDSTFGTRRSSQLSDIFHYLDEETQDAVFYQEEESFDSLDVLSRKIETEIKTLYGQKCKASGSPPTILVNLFETSLNVANHLMALSDNEPYGVRGARIILNFRNLNGVEETIGSFMVDPNTISTFEITLSLEQGQQFSTSLRSWFGQMTSGSKSILIGPQFVLRKKDLYTSARSESVIHHT